MTIYNCFYINKGIQPNFLSQHTKTFHSNTIISSYSQQKNFTMSTVHHFLFLALIMVHSFSGLEMALGINLRNPTKSVQIPLKSSMDSSKSEGLSNSKVGSVYYGFPVPPFLSAPSLPFPNLPPVPAFPFTPPSFTSSSTPHHISRQTNNDDNESPWINLWMKS